MRFIVHPPRCDRVHHVTVEDVRTVLGRLPAETTTRLRAIHFNDRSRGARVLGYVNRGRREIALCALPPHLSLTRFLVKGQSPALFGACRGRQWPVLAIRRFLLYDVLLHELGHLQVIDEKARSPRRQFAMETRAQQFAMDWCRRLWSSPFDHPDPVHNAPTTAERQEMERQIPAPPPRTLAARQQATCYQELGKLLNRWGKPSEARLAFAQSLSLAPRDPWTHLYLGNWHYQQGDHRAALAWFTRAIPLLPGRAVPWWCLGNVYETLGDRASANWHYRKAVEVEPCSGQAHRFLRRWRQRTAALGL